MTLRTAPCVIPDLRSGDNLLRFGTLFCHAKIVLTAVELGVFPALDGAPATGGELARRLGLRGRGAADFFRTLAAIGVLDCRDGRYHNSAGAHDYLVPGRPGYLGGFLLGANSLLYPAYDGLAEALRTGHTPFAQSPTRPPRGRRELEKYAAMKDGLHDSVGRDLTHAFPWPGRGYVVELGGCRGNVLGHVLRAHPELTGGVFDLPQFEPLFTDHMAERGLASRTAFHGGAVFAADLPAADVLICGHVLCRRPPDDRRKLVHKAFHALGDGGVLLVYDRMLGERDDRESLVAGLSLLLVTDGGGEYPLTALTEDALDAGFGSVTATPLGAFDTLAVCTKE
ncbi:methyltransferase [Amycolatopsis ultiminotia]|uniref:Methyltransferase n=1 Tax=Amycolatopsis ultiminotia TaxID=543629 RepID=A0ABP6XAM1_9PSEU